MAHRILTNLACVCVLGILCISEIHAATASEIIAAYDQMEEPEMDETAIYRIDSLTIEHHSLNLVIEEGEFCFFKPIVLDGDTVRWGGFFRGMGWFQFEPPVQMEKDQLQRWFKSDSLNRYFKEALLLFDSRTVEQIVSHGVPVSDVDMGKFGHANRHMDAFTKVQIFQSDDTSYPLAKAIRNILFPLDKPFLLTSLHLDSRKRVLYMFDQYDREEVSFKRHHWAPGENYLELINSYSIYLDDSYDMINGIRREAISVKHYNIEAEIDRSGDFTARAEMTLKALLENTQLIRFKLDPELTIDSVAGTPGGAYGILTAKKHGYRPWDRYLILNQPLAAGDSASLTFFCSGELIEQAAGEFFVDAGASWYPRHGFRQLATFDISYKTPEDYSFVSTGELQESEKIGRVLHTRWVVKQPAANVSFNIGGFKKFDFVEDDAPPVEVYFSKSLHKKIACSLKVSMEHTGRHMERQVADDVINSLRLFSHRFGEYPGKKLVVTEVLASHGEAFPGFLHLGVKTWINTDAWGEDRLFRAHEVAHQWWGVGVGYDSYHDKWLSEGFAEYSALIYYQAVADNDKFLDRLKDIRKEIFSNRKSIFGSGAEAGPIALGHRTSSTKTRGDFSLIIYKKGAFVLHMLRNMLIDLQNFNEDRFFAMMKEYYQKFRGGRATTKAFRKLTEKYVGIDMGWFFDQWVYGNDLPTYRFTYKMSMGSDGKWLSQCNIKTENVPDSFKMYVPLEIEFENERRAYFRLLVDKTDFDFSLPALENEPKKLRLNPFESVLADVKQ